MMMSTMSSFKRIKVNKNKWAVVGARWFPPVGRRSTDQSSTDFNSFIDDPDGTIGDCVNEANSDIRAGRVSTFGSCDEMISSLKRRS
jgi:hypothetical protein